MIILLDTHICKNAALYFAGYTQNMDDDRRTSIEAAFIWSRTPPGSRYWNDISNRVERWLTANGQWNEYNDEEEEDDLS